MLLQKVYSHVDLLEVKYFGLQFTDNHNVDVSLSYNSFIYLIFSFSLLQRQRHNSIYYASYIYIQEPPGNEQPTHNWLDVVDCPAQHTWQFCSMPAISAVEDGSRASDAI